MITTYTYYHQGLTLGFRIGFQGGSRTPNQYVLNLDKALQRPHAVDCDLDREIKLDRILGPWPSPPFGSSTVTSPIGLVEKKSSHGKYWIIHLFFTAWGGLHQYSILSKCTTGKYASVDYALNMILRLARNCYLPKTDIKAALHIMPVHRYSYHLAFIGNHDGVFSP